jgi:hypothetical protein
MSIDFASIPWGTFLAIGILIGILIGWGIGFADSNIRTRKKIESAEANAAIAITEAEKKIAEANQRLAEQAPQPVPQVVTVDEPGLLRLKNDRGYYALEMDGVLIRSALAPDGRKRLIDLLTVIRPYLEGNLPPQAAVSVAPMPTAAPIVAPTPRPVPAPTPAPPQVTSAPVPEAPAGDATPKTLINPDDTKEMAKLGMIAQIDAVLQWRLVKSPLARRGIRVTEAPGGGGVRVEVGIEKFEAVDDVSDPEVKAFIKACIAEWEKKATPG